MAENYNQRNFDRTIIEQLEDAADLEAAKKEREHNLCGIGGEYVCKNCRYFIECNLSYKTKYDENENPILVSNL